MELIDLVQWPAMVVSVVAAWLVGAKSKRKRNWGFWTFIVSNVLWILWGVYSKSWALVVLQLALGTMNIRGAKKTAE